MKPSISIDLPGWCTLRRDNNSDDEAPDEAVEARSSHSSSVGGPDDVSDRSGKGAGNGSVLGDLESSGDEAGGEDAIARLFSLGGLKRRRSGSESQLESARNDQADAARKRRRRAANISVGLDLQAEAYLDWPCVRCTFINAFDQEMCQGCGGANLKRQRYLRERRKEVERLVRLQSARETRDRSLKEEALKDVLEDSDSENELGLAQSSSTAPDTIGRQSPISTSVSTFSEDLSTSRHANIVTAATAAATTATKPVSEAQIIVGHSTASEQRRTPQGCYVNILPPDLLLQCAEFLGDVLTLSRVREVSLGWLVALDRREGGRRLWRPVFYRLRASGSIHATTDTNGQQRRSLKVYDLFGASSGATKASTATTVTSSREGTPSPSRAAQRWSSVGGEFARQNSRLSVGAETGGNPASEAGSGQGSSPPLRRSSACLVCGLIQRQGYTGSDCEMCSSSLMLLPSSVSPTTPRVPYTRVNLTESADVKQRPTGKSKLHSLASAPEIPTATVNARWGGGGSNVHGSTYRGDVEDVEDMGEGGDVDWHFLVKKLAEEKRIASGWGSLHHGWVWLQHALEAMLHRRMDGEPPPTLSNAEKTPPNHNMRQGTVEGSAGVERGRVRSGRGDDGGLGDLDPTISRLVRKLANKGWVRFYDSLKATFTLQAEGIARQVVFDADAIADNAAAAALGVDEAPREAAVIGIGLERLRLCIAAWEAYKDWCEEVDMYCELLNEQISAERYRTAGLGCGRGDNTPFIRDTALLSFRHSFALHVQICSILRMAIARGVCTVQLDSNMTSRDLPLQPSSRREGDADGEISLSAKTTVESAGAVGAAVSNAEELFTDQELMEDSRAVDFAMRSFSGQGAGGRSSNGKSGVDVRIGASGVDEYCGRTSGVKVGSTSRVVVSSGSKKNGHYYDWFLSKLEGQEAGIVRGDVDARGKRLIQPAAGPCDGLVRAGREGEAGAGRDVQEPQGLSDTLATAGLQELLELTRDMIEELDVPDDHLSKDRHTQGAMRRLLLLPIKRWQAVVADANEDDPQNLLMAGLSPAPGKEGFHRLRGGAAGRRTGTPPLSALGKDAGKSWEKLSSLFD